MVAELVQCITLIRVHIAVEAMLVQCALNPLWARSVDVRMVLVVTDTLNHSRGDYLPYLIVLQ